MSIFVIKVSLRSQFHFCFVKFTIVWGPIALWKAIVLHLKLVVNADRWIPLQQAHLALAVSCPFRALDARKLVSAANRTMCCENGFLILFSL